MTDPGAKDGGASAQLNGLGGAADWVQRSGLGDGGAFAQSILDASDPAAQIQAELTNEAAQRNDKAGQESDRVGTCIEAGATALIFAETVSMGVAGPLGALGAGLLIGYFGSECIAGDKPFGGRDDGTAPSNDPPASDPPASDPPASDPPASDPPSSDPPASDPPSSDPPECSPDHPDEDFVNPMDDGSAPRGSIFLRGIGNKAEGDGDGMGPVGSGRNGVNPMNSDPSGDMNGGGDGTGDPLHHP
jgi:hypothetical protein